MNTQAASLPSLSTELQLHIISYLHFPDTINLGNTSHHFKQIMPALTIEDLLALEKNPHSIYMANPDEFYANFFACNVCVRLLPKEKFGDVMRKGQRGKNGNQRHRRFCIECGIRLNKLSMDGVLQRLYSLGSHIVVMGERFVVCRRCGGFEPASVRASQHVSELSGCCGRCLDSDEELRDEELEDEEIEDEELEDEEIEDEELEDEELEDEEIEDEESEDEY